MKLRKFCSKCGKLFEDNEEIFEGFLCQSCYGKTPEEIVFPDEITLNRCYLCDAFGIKKNEQEFEWEYQPEGENTIDFMTRLLYKNIFFHLEKKHESEYQLFLDSNLDIYADKPFSLIIQRNAVTSDNKINKTIKIKIHERCCPYCAKRVGGRFDAVIQIRIQNPMDKDRLKEIMETCAQIEEEEKFRDPKNFFSKIEKTPNGFDLKLSTNTMLRIVSQKLNKKYCFQMKRSTKLIKRDPETGQDLYRQHLLLKLVPVIRDDIIRIESEEYRVTHIFNNRVFLVKPATQELSTVPYTIFEKKKYIILSRKETTDAV